MSFARWAVLPLLVALSACATAPVRERVAEKPAPAPAPAPPPAEGTAVTAGVKPGADIATLNFAGKADAALAAFRSSCAVVTRRQDRSGLTRPEDWKPACDAVGSATDAGAFFTRHFETALVGPGEAFITGYYEPEIAGSRTQRTANQVPVYRRPADLLDVDLGAYSDDLKGKRIRGRVDGRNLVPYFTRAEIDAGALANKGLEIGWADDGIEFFFLQIQGSGRLQMPDGSVMRIGYDGQNGRDYVGIGKRLRDMGKLAPGQASMEGIMAWLRANPVEGRAVMHENKSFIFFRELTGPGPVGAINVAVTPQISVAADPAFVPLGAPVWIGGGAPIAGLWVAQDTGGAIKGANRYDSFWGAGADARKTAGGMSMRAPSYVLVPKGTVARLSKSVGDARPTQP